ncbi:MAG: Crp/Fnr family transcriptional regulator [Candidatus Eremiobacteraeota bacterium]|nr:Crp/Fnr family transcriptional regulator [Candidatus Eremiobacteraeota bacterium]
MAQVLQHRLPPENTVWYLRRRKLFECSGEVLAGARHLFALARYPKRTMIFEVGDDSRLVYFIKSGRIRLSRVLAANREVAIAVLGPGDVFGEEALFGQVNRTTIATCIEDSFICTSRADKLFELISTRPAFALNLARYSSQRHGEAISAIEDIAFLSVSKRLLKLLERLAHDFGVCVSAGIEIDVRLTQADLAALIGSTRETVSVELSKLVKTGRLRMSRGRFVLQNDLVQRGPNSEAMMLRRSSAVRV